MKSVPIVVSPDTFKQSAFELQTMLPSPVFTRAGLSDVLITCVHGLAHVRDGVPKLKDSGTLETSHLIAVASDSNWLAVGELGARDSNYHRNTQFKDYLDDHLERHPPKLVVDIRGSHAMRPFDVEIGTLDQASWLGRSHWCDEMQSALRASGFMVSDNQVFRAFGAGEHAETITSFCYTRGVPSVQLEISSALMEDLQCRQALHSHAKLVNAIAGVLAYLPPEFPESSGSEHCPAD